jgi:hypothetical protein
MVTVNAFVAVCGVELESFAWTVKELVLLTVGVPLKAPLEEFNTNPVGRDPVATDQEYGAVPPVAAKLAEYALPVCPLGNDTLVIETGFDPAAAIVTLNDFTAVSAAELESFTWIVKETVPDWVGVPFNAPLVAFSATPAGREEPVATDQVYGVLPPLAVKVAEYTEPTCPPGSAVVVIDTAEAVDTTKLSALLAVCGVPLASLTCTVKENVPD